jgi:hypothetical protein
MGYIYVNGRRVEVHESADYQDGVFIGTILRYLFIAAWWVLKVATCGIVILVVWIYRKIKAKVDQANAEKYGHLRCLTKWVADTVDGKPCVTFTSTLSNNGDKDIAQMDGRIILSEGGCPSRPYKYPSRVRQTTLQGFG